jgi:hypothetical protein
LENEPEGKPDFKVPVAGDPTAVIIEALVEIQASIHALAPLLMDILAAVSGLSEEDKAKVADQLIESQKTLVLRYMYDLQKPRD